MNKYLYFLLIILYASCKSMLNTDGGKIYHSYKEYAYQYINDSLDFSMAYYGGSKFKLNPTRKDLKLSIPVNMLILKQHQNLLMRVGTLGMKDAGFVAISNRESDSNYSDNVLASIQSKYKVDSVLLLNDVGFENLKNYKINKLSYIVTLKKQQYGVQEYHIAWHNHKMLRIVSLKQKTDIDQQLIRIIDLAASFSVGTFQDSIKKKQIDACKSIYFYVHNSYIDYNFNYLNTIDVIHTLETQKNVPDAQKSMFLNTKAYYLSFVGDYQNMLKCRDIEDEKFVWSQEDSIKIEKYTAFDAQSSILKETKKYQIVMFNENHLNPYCRVFVKDMLDSLKRQGFNYIGLEALANFNNTAISEGRFPLQKLGSYTAEPSMANLIRTASSLGFTIFSYEYNTPSDSTERVAKRNHREKSQALNIIEILKKDPTAKIIIHAGHDHIQKMSENKKSFMMANYFRRLTNINPLCIEQATMNESFEEKREYPAYRQTMKKYKPLKSIVLKQDSTFWVQSNRQGFHDICVFHPRTIYENIRPTWLTQSTGTKEYKFTTNNIDLDNTITQVYVKKEFDQDFPNITPLINRITSKNQHFFTFYLNSGDYVILIRDKYGSILFNKIIKID